MSFLINFLSKTKIIPWSLRLRFVKSFNYSVIVLLIAKFQSYRNQKCGHDRLHVLLKLSCFSVSIYSFNHYGVCIVFYLVPLLPKQYTFKTIPFMSVVSIFDLVLVKSFDVLLGILYPYFIPEIILEIFLVILSVMPSI
jgi:hypothetical protein